jgi:hypothetical protein
MLFSSKLNLAEKHAALAERFARLRPPVASQVIAVLMGTFPTHGCVFYSLMVIAVTGQLSTASRQAGSLGGGTGVAMTSATAPVIEKTAGQICAHRAQPIQVSLFTCALIVISFYANDLSIKQ